MRVRSFELTGAKIRELHDYLMDVGGFQFRAGGQGFFVLVGERFLATDGGNAITHTVVVQNEADVTNVDLIVIGGTTAMRHTESDASLSVMMRSTELLRGFAERHDLEIVDL